MKVAIVGLGYVGLPLCLQFARNGAQVNNINFSRMEFSNCGSAFFVFLGQQPGHPVGDVDKLGSINNVHFTDILCSVDNSTSATWGSLITGQNYPPPNGTTYPITNLFFTNCNTAVSLQTGVPGRAKVMARYHEVIGELGEVRYANLATATKHDGGTGHCILFNCVVRER